MDSILISTTTPSTGDLVLYRNDRQITHAGLVAADRIISKWGKGHLWIHGLLEVPAQYGGSTSIATLVIAFYAYSSINLTKEIHNKSEQSQRELSDLYEAIVVATLLSGPSSVGGFASAKQIFSTTQLNHHPLRLFGCSRTADQSGAER